MAQRYIRYEENGVWKYASVKDVGNLSMLKTSNKTDLVSAINELYSNGGASQVPADVAERLTFLEKRTTDLQTSIANKADLTYVDGELVKKVNLDKYNVEFDKIKSDMLNKVDLAKHKSDYDSLTLSLASKVDESGFNTLKGKVDTVETNVTKIQGEVSSKVSHKEFDDAVGVNQWTASKYPITGTDLNTTPPSFPLIKGITASQVEQVPDAQNLVVFNENNIITHYFTNVKMKVATTLTLSLTYDDSVAVYMNGAKMYENHYNGVAIVNVSLPLRAGWNTIEILHGNAVGTPVLDLGLKLSTSVDKMTTVIGVGDKNETRLTQAETEIKQTTDSINLLATKDEVTAMGNKVKANEASISILNTEIVSKVSNTEFNNYSKRLSTAESKITQTESSIANKVDKLEYDVLNNKVNSQGTSITQLQNDISLKVDTLTFDGLKGRMDKAETQINLNKKEIGLKASQESLNTIDGKVSSVESELKIQAGKISSKVSQTEIDNSINALKTTELEPLKNTVTKQGTEITQTKSLIESKAEKTSVYTKLEVDNQIKAVETSTNTKISQNADAINLKANTIDVYTKLHVDGELGKKANASELNALVTRVQTAETNIDQNAKAITLSATKEDLSTSISQAKAEIKLTTDGITQQVNGLSSTVTEQGKKFSSYDSSISTMKNEIKSKVGSAEIETAIQGIKIGGTNLLPNSGFDYALDGWSTTPAGSTGIDVDKGRLLGSSGIITVTANGGGFRTPNTIDNTIVGGQTYTISLWIKSSVALTVGHTMIFKDSSGLETSPIATISKSVQADTWTKFEDTFVAPLTAVAMATTPIVVSGHTGANVTLWVDEVKIEEGNKATSWSPSNNDVNSTIESISVRLKNAEQSIEDDRIVSTVTTSQSFVNALDEKANASDLSENYVTNDALRGEVAKMSSTVDDKIKAIDLSPFVKGSELNQTADSLTTKFTASGGVNLLKNSVGYAGLDFWTPVNSDSIATVSHKALDVLGFGSGYYFMPKTLEKSIKQEINVSVGNQYTLSWHINKENNSTLDGALSIEIQENGVTVASYKYLSDKITAGYEQKSITYTAKLDKATVIINSEKNVDATITGLMFNVGSIPLQWTMAHGEVYNASIRMDMKGIRVSKIEDNKESRFTVMTPNKFAGYYDVDGDGFIDDNDNSPDEVFRMNDDEFVMKKAVVKEEISLGSLKVLKIDSASNKGWAFVPTE